MAKPWQLVGSVETDEGKLELRQRGEKDALITIDGRVLMNAHANVSELVLAELACEPLRNAKNPRVLVSGLGMGFTLRAALDSLPAGAEVVVAELNPVVVEWCRGPIAHLSGAALDDPRVGVVVGDVTAVIREAAGKGAGTKGEGGGFDAIILDLYEGPYRGAKCPLFGDRALASSRAALRPGGVYAVWSEDPDNAFERRLRAAGFAVATHRPGRGGRKHVVYIGRTSGGG